MMEAMRMQLSRRQILALLGESSLVALPTGADAVSEVVVHNDPSCGCCSGWSEHLQRAGFPIRIAEDRNLDALKQSLGIPVGLASCHTAEVGGYVIEGHV